MDGDISKKTFFGRFAMPIACLVCLLFPMALRGARISVQNMRNAVADWLPPRFEETARMQWFWQHFVGDRYIMASWEGCTATADDSIYQCLLSRLRPPIPPSRQHVQPAGGPAQPEAADPARPAEQASTTSFGIRVARDYEFAGDQLGLMPDDHWHADAGGRQEKWVRAIDKKWYFITPDGSLFRWTSPRSPWGRLFAYGWRKLTGAEVHGVLVAEFGPVDGPWYYADPNRLAAQLFQQVTTGPQMVGALTADDDAALPGNEAAARRRMAGILLGSDGQQSCVVLTLSDVGRRDLHAVIGRPVFGRQPGKLYALAEACGLPFEQLHLGGPPVDNVAIDEEGTVTLLRLVTLSGLLGIALSYACFRSIKATVIVFIVGGVSAVGSLAMVGWFGSLLDAILMAMPALIYVLAISGAVHLMNYYREALDTTGPRGAVETAIAHGWAPALLCNVTTTVGLFALMTSDLTPIRKFGFFSGLAVMATVILLFSLLPAALQLFPLKPRHALASGQDSHAAGLVESKLWTVVGNFMIRRHVLVSVTCMLTILIVGWGSRYLLTSVNLLNMFDANSKIIRDYTWLEQSFGKLVPLEVVVQIPSELQQPLASQPPGAGHRSAGNLLSFLDRMILVDRLQSVVQRELGTEARRMVGASMSAATMALPVTSEFGSFTGRLATNVRLIKNRPALLKSDYLTLDEDQAELWRISFRIGAGAGTDYGQIVSQMQRAIEPVMTAYRVRDQLLRTLPPPDELPRARRVLFLLTPASLTQRAHAPPVERPPDFAADTLISTERQSEILASTLSSLLKSSRIQVELRRAGPQAAADHETLFAGVDAVVLLGESSTAMPVVSPPPDCVLIDARVSASQDASASHEVWSAGSDSLRAIYTGIIPVVTKAQRTLLTSLITSSFWSFVTITPLMIFVCRSVAGGLVVMLPNVLPIFVVFGAMGWIQMPIDIGSMMSASIALGVAVDDTIHFLSWFRVALNELGDRQLAILAAYKHCATPTLQAALISGLGLSIFSFSTFIPIKRFGFLMLAILFAGVAAELIFLPALLAGPLGKVFQPRKSSSGVKLPPGKSASGG